MKGTEKNTSRLQHEMHDGFTAWSNDHKNRYKHMGTLPYLPRLFPDQKIDKPSRKINRAAVYLPESAYLRAYKYAFAKTVGSKALAGTIVDSFHAQAAFGQPDSPTLLEYATQCLEENQTLAVASGHADRLSDIAEFTAGLSIAVAETNGRKYIERFWTIINKNMTRETYLRVPMPWMATIGLGVYWGLPPGESATKFGISDEAIGKVNARLSQQFIADKRQRSIVLGLVPSGSGMGKELGANGQLEKLTVKDASYTAPLMVRCEAGIIPVNRYADNFRIGSVIKTGKPEGISKKDFEKQLSDKVVGVFTEQVSEMAQVPVSFTRVSDQRTNG